MAYFSWFRFRYLAFSIVGFRFEITWNWKAENTVLFHGALRFSHHAFIIFIHRAVEGFDLPMHSDADNRITRPIPSLWILLKKPTSGGELMVNGPVRGHGRLKLFNGRDHHGVSPVIGHSRIVFIAQHFSTKPLS